MERLWLNSIPIEAYKKTVRDVNKSKARPVLKALADLLLLTQLSHLADFSYKMGNSFNILKFQE